MNNLEEWNLLCPYCGENISVLLDCSLLHQTYTEDCQVCCQPIELDVVIDFENRISVQAERENN